MNFTLFTTAIAQNFLDEQLARIVYQRLRCVQDLENEAELSLLLTLENMYRAYYTQRSNQLQEVLFLQKEACVNSYITYDKQYYQDSYEKSVQALDKYRQNVTDSSIYEDFSRVGFAEIDDNYPQYFLKPQLLELYKGSEKLANTSEVTEATEKIEVTAETTEKTEESKQPGDAMP